MFRDISHGSKKSARILADKLITIPLAILTAVLVFFAEYIIYAVMFLIFLVLYPILRSFTNSQTENPENQK